MSNKKQPDRERFTKEKLERYKPIEGKSRTYIYDTDVNGLVICLTQPSAKNPKGVKSFQVYQWSKAKGRPMRVTLGTFPAMKLADARRQAKVIVSDIANDKDPNQVKKARRGKKVTLSQCFDDYMAARGRDLAKNTKDQYRRVVEKKLADWQGKPLSSITRDMVKARHTQLTKESPTAANSAMRVLRLLFNFAAGEYENESGKSMFPDNPVSKISHTRSWNKETRRTGMIKVHELEAWFEAVLALDDGGDKFAGVVSAYYRFLLLNGLRRREAANLKIEDVDFQAKTFTVTETKNKKPLSLPLTDYCLELLTSLKGRRSGGYLFRGKDNRPINDARAKLDQVRNVAGLSFTHHDLRRTFITFAERLDISAYSLKALVNHSVGEQRDVTAGYVQIDVERLRTPMNQIQSFILSSAGLVCSAEVIAMSASKALR